LDRIETRVFPSGKATFVCRVCRKQVIEKANYVQGFVDEDGNLLGYCDGCANKIAIEKAKRVFEK
jgi:hypothetical protein